MLVNVSRKMFICSAVAMPSTEYSASVDLDTVTGWISACTSDRQNDDARESK